MVKKRGVNFGDFTTLFRQAYGLEQPAPASPGYQQILKKAEKDFRESFQDYLRLLGVVPREEYVELARKYEKLEEKLTEQEEIIKRLRKLLSDKGLDSAAVSLEFQKLMKKQGKQFQELMKDFGETFKESAADAEAP